ncbi:alkaline phosphatase family protein [Sphingomonas crusticola]|uniref:alkaline phosphatase family protein n=1 Tax=Sphingomonas crusticola TaxID=1697973 RepID=UPI000E281DE8|nr:alkaline phosphatase family protein [Sphingomonas crusticola]
MTRLGIWFAAAWLAAGNWAGATAQAAPPQPKLVVAIAVDQFSAELFQRYRPSFTGGLRRLGDGIAFTGYQSHAATETCPGHSTILTGRHPAATGIVANSWFDAKSGSSVYCVAVRGTADPDARGPQNLRVSTFGDWLKQAQPQARVVSISGKDRAAIMLGGHKADAVYWWKDGIGFTTSSYAGPATADVTGPAATFDQALFARWKAAPPKLWPSDVSAACQALAQPHLFGKLAISGKVPPDLSLTAESGDFLGSADFQDQLRVSPIFDPMTLDFADQTIDRLKLGHGPATDLLAVSLSSTDYIGHRYGNGGAEMCVQMAALDQALGAFLAKLDSLGVPYVVALTADHGGIDAAERASEHGVDARRIDPAAFVKALNDAMKTQLGLAFEPIVGDDPQQLTVNVGPDEALRAKVRDAAVAWLKQRPEVAAVFTADETAAAVPAPGTTADQLSIVERFHESYDKERSGDIQVQLLQYASVGMPRAPGDGVAGHGSPWDYDRRVPILFWWPGVGAAQRPEPIETVDIAPTLAAVTGVAAPQVDGKCLVMVAATCR